MAYTTDIEVADLIPNAVSGASYTTYIAHAAAVIDSRLRKWFVVPFNPVDALVAWIATRLAAAECLAKRNAARSAEPSPYSVQLKNEAMKELDAIVADPARIGNELRDATTDDGLARNVPFSGRRIRLDQARPD